MLVICTCCKENKTLIKSPIYSYIWFVFGVLVAARKAYINRRFLDIFSISGNVLMNHFFSIVKSSEKVKNGSVRFCGSDAPFH